VDILALVFSVILFIIGIIGTILPALPGPIFIYFGVLLYGIMTGFASLGVFFYIIEAIVLIIIFLSDYFSAAIGTQKFGGNKYTAYGAIIGTILALIFLGPLGIVIGPFLGVIVVEFLQGTEFKQAIRSGFGALVGILGGMLFKIAAEILMIIYFVIVVF